jgi:hypothetical protein
MKLVSVLLSIGEVVVTCEICGKGPAEEGQWTLCPECTQLFKTLLQFAKQHDVNPKNLESLKEILKSQARQIGLI